MAEINNDDKVSGVTLRETKKDDIDSIYKLCCLAELNESLLNKPHIGFLLAHYSAHPEFKEIFVEHVGKTPFFVVEYNNRILGSTLGYTQEQWKTVRGGLIDAAQKDPLWIPGALEKLEILDPHSIGYSVCEKIVTHPDARGMGVGKMLIEALKQNSNSQFQYSEVVEKVFSGENLLPLENIASQKFHEKVGAVKVARSHRYSYDKSYLGEDGSFVDGIYLLPLGK
ncbi:MAG: GNAT family N-acetyltransferase [Nanoarchaeota archaeon]|nr:GNAT family N-acetyltransferase [Nanoarchaeota archaeon]